MDDKKQVEVLSDTSEEIDVLSFDEPVTQNNNEVLTFDDVDTLEPIDTVENIDVLSEEPTITIPVQPSVEPVQEPIINNKIDLDATIILEPAKNQVIRKEPTITENVEEFKIAEPILNENIDAEPNVDVVLEEASHHEPTDNTIELYINDIYKQDENVTAPDLLANPSNNKESSTDPGYNSYGKEKKKTEKTNPKTTATSIFLFVLLLVAVSGFIAYEYLIPKKNNSTNNNSSSSNMGTVNNKTVTCTFKSSDIKLTKVLIYNDSLREVTEVRYTYSLDPNVDPTTLKIVESNIYLALLYLPTDFEIVQDEEGVTYDYNASVDKISVSFSAKRTESSSDLLIETIFGEYLDATVSDIVQDAKELGLTCSIE